MKFEEALQSLRSHKVLTRTAWKGKWIELKNGQLVMITQRSNSCKYYYREMDFDNDDILADDWEIVNRDIDIKQFYLSVNDLEILGVNQSAIDDLKEKQPLFGAIEISPRDEYEEQKELYNRNFTD